MSAPTSTKQFSNSLSSEGKLSIFFGGNIV
jgi:hypothetical protein